METRANYVLIGSFTLAVIAAAFGFVLWFQSLHTTKTRSPLARRVRRPGSGPAQWRQRQFQRYQGRGGDLGEARQSASGCGAGHGREQCSDPEGHPGGAGIPGADRGGRDLAQGRRGGRASGSAGRGRHSDADGGPEPASGRHRSDPRHAAEHQQGGCRQPGGGQELAKEPRDLHRVAGAQFGDGSTTSWPGSMASWARPTA